MKTYPYAILWSLCLMIGIAFSAQWLKGIAAGDDPPQENQVDYSKELPRFKPLEPSDALRSFEIVPGYSMELAAAEPLVRDPVALAFDADARMYVVEMCDYSEQANDFLGNVRLLCDTDGDGRYESSSFFAEGLSWPTAVICYDDGVFVGAAPDVWFLKDTDHDGVADIKKKIFTGFGRANVQGLLNSFCWGPDNRIYGQTSASGGSIVRADKIDAPLLILNGRDFSFNPKTLEIRAEAGGAQHGMCFDDWGHRFASHNSDHLQQFVYEDRYSARTAEDIVPPPRQSIAVDGPQAEVFRISPVEPWRVLRTHLRVSKQVPGLVEGGGRAAGYFTGATGATIYRGDAMPELRGQAFIGDVGSNIVHRKRIVDSGIVFRGERIDAGREFVASTDTWFRPAQFANAPDGSLLILDVYREVIEHPASLPPDIKKHLDLTSGRDRGRIYRIVPDGFDRPKFSSLSSATTRELVATLEHRNGWHRDTASRLSYERQDPESIMMLLKATESQVAEARFHAMQLLHSFGELKYGLLLRLMDDPNSNVTDWIASQLGHEVSSQSDLVPSAFRRSFQINALRGVQKMEPRQQFHFAMALSGGPVADDDMRAVLVGMMKRSEDDPYLLGAAIRALHRDDVILAMMEVVAVQCSDSTCHAIASTRASELNPAELEPLDRWLASIQPSSQLKSLLHGLFVALAKADKWKQVTAPESKLKQLSQALHLLIADSQKRCAQSELTVEQRLKDIAVLRWDDRTESLVALRSMLESPQAQPVQLAAIDGLRRWSDIAVVDLFVDVWPKSVPSVRSAMGKAILSKLTWTQKLLDSIERGTLSVADLDPMTLELLQSNALLEARERAKQLIHRHRQQQTSRDEIVEDYRARVFSLIGNRELGRGHFQRLCASCHRVENVGHELGPNLASFKYRGVEAILLNVLDPNREVNPQYINYIARTNDDRILTGMIRDESATQVTLVRGESATDKLQLSEIESLKSSQKSIMPEGFEQQLDHQSMADLLSYLTSLP